MFSFDPALPRAVWIAEVHGDVGRNRELSVRGEFAAAVPGQGLSKAGREPPDLPGQGADDLGRLFRGQPHEEDIARLAFHEGRHIRIDRAHE